MYERRRTFRHDLRLRVHLYGGDRSGYQYAHLENINHTGVYLITRRRLNMNEKVEMAIPAEPEQEAIKIRVKVIRFGNHRSWGLFSYGCHIIQSD